MMIKYFIVILLLFIGASKKSQQYVVKDIVDDNDYTYVFILQEVASEKVYVFETNKGQMDIEKCVRTLSKGDTIKVKLVKNKVHSKFTISRPIKSFNSLEKYSNQGMNTDHYCCQIKGNCLIR
ncbi:hypothetical protein NBRC110019_27560 [Neptunitalea chrysea]|uniref:Uncharacterized protein n=1 Tax=Neptunitalea chrysea TaxID=1647581 RepID=A0A9W6B8J0_9FLAO|nr:hypothetical protein [Neptunitalea chrysea]GLB53715.1 hypothetical protein NBRC110019_27560 [Neptunitalea chrysea]